MENTQQPRILRSAELQHTVIDGKTDQLSPALKFKLGHYVGAMAFDGALGNAQLFGNFRVQSEQFERGSGFGACLLQHSATFVCVGDDDVDSEPIYNFGDHPGIEMRAEGRVEHIIEKAGEVAESAGDAVFRKNADPRLRGECNLVEGGGERKNSFTCTFRERGEHVVAWGEVSSPFPINFFVRSRRTPIQCRIVVFPAPLRAQLPGGHDKPGTGGVLTAASKGYEGDVAKIGDYSGTEPLKLIHWRLSAKHGELKVKELTAGARTPVIIDIDTLQGRSLEENLSRATFLINRLMKSNRPVGLKFGERILAPAVSRTHRLRLLSELALYGKH